MMLQVHCKQLPATRRGWLSDPSRRHGAVSDSYVGGETLVAWAGDAARSIGVVSERAKP